MYHYSVFTPDRTRTTDPPGRVPNRGKTLSKSGSVRKIKSSQPGEKAAGLGEK
jgi:hypothetical protein